MKRAYATPEVEKIEFRYRDQVVVASGYVNPCEYFLVFHYAGADDTLEHDENKCYIHTSHMHKKEYPCDYPMPDLG